MSTVAADAAKHGACLWCSDDRVVVWHDDTCPNEPEGQAMREQSAPCVFATRLEVLHHRHMTFNDSRVCDRPVCVERAAVLTARAAVLHPERVS